jgi:hypothetical protein
MSKIFRMMALCGCMSVMLANDSFGDDPGWERCKLYIDEGNVQSLIDCCVNCMRESPDDIEGCLKFHGCRGI